MVCVPPFSYHMFQGFKFDTMNLLNGPEAGVLLAAVTDFLAFQLPKPASALLL